MKWRNFFSILSAIIAVVTIAPVASAAPERKKAIVTPLGKCKVLLKWHLKC